MNENDTKRLSRLVAIITLLQTKRVVTASLLGNRFGVTTRTIYRDIKALEQAGVPVLTEEGKGYSLMEGYRIPPVMFTQPEANALITAAHLVLKNPDSSLTREYSSAINKIKAVLQYTAKEKVALLNSRITVSAGMQRTDNSNSLSAIQDALTAFNVLAIVYQAEDKGRKTTRKIEPFAFYYSQQQQWVLIAYCRLRKDFRMFRLDRILAVETLDLKFSPHKLRLEEYLENKIRNFHNP